jgi:tetratricopeptide (TPR) repeat protein
MLRCSKVLVIAAGVALLFLSGCVTLKPGWKDAPPATADPGGAAAQLAKGQALFDDADSREKLQDAISAYEEVLQVDSDNYEALTALCEAHTLDAAAYVSSKKEKKPIYQRGIAHCDRALYTNLEFRDLVDQGIAMEEAAHALTAREARATIFWVTGVSYYFKECLGASRLANYRLMVRSEALLNRLMEIDPDYLHGVVHFSRGIYYLSLPKYAGGDRDLSAELMARAEEVGPDSILVRWGRAKYYYFETKNRDGFERDLRWVVEQDPRTSSMSYPWNVYFQRDASELLENVDRLF